MKLNTQRKIYLGGLVLAATAFAADRCFFTPKSLAANPALEANAGAPASPRKRTVIAINTGNSENLTDFSEVSKSLVEATHAAQIDSANPIDAFRPSSAWVARAAAKSKKPLLSSVEQFRARHRLTAVMTGEQTGWAIVDGKAVSLGQSIDHFQLIKIHDRSATFESLDANVELQVAK